MTRDVWKEFAGGDQAIRGWGNHWTWRLMPLSGWRSISILTQMHNWTFGYSCYHKQMGQGVKLTSHMQTVICVALGISPGSVNMPTSTFITKHKSLAVGMPWGWWETEMDWSLCMLSAMHSQGLCGLVLDYRRQNNDSGGEQFGTDIHDCSWHVHLPTHS